MDFLDLTPLTLLQKPHFWPILWLKVDLLPDLGGCVAPPHPPGYGPGFGDSVKDSDNFETPKVFFFFFFFFFVEFHCSIVLKEHVLSEKLKLE